jgi:hypothetical protein
MCIASNLEKIHDRWVGNNLNGKDCGLLKVLPWSWPWMVEETHKESHLHFPITSSGFEWDLSRIQIQGLTATTGVSVYGSVIAPSCRSKADRKQCYCALLSQQSRQKAVLLRPLVAAKPTESSVIAPSCRSKSDRKQCYCALLSQQSRQKAVPPCLNNSQRWLLSHG